MTESSVADGTVGNVLLTGDKADIFDNTPCGASAMRRRMAENVAAGTTDIASLLTGGATPRFHRFSMRTLVLVALAVVVLVGCWNWYFGEIVVAYRLTAEVQVDGERHVGSGVVEIHYRRDPFAAMDQNGPWSIGVVGEAVPVSLGRHGTLFFTLGDNDNHKGAAQWLPVTVIGNPAIGEWGPKYFERLATAKGLRDIPLKLLPRLVLFSDPTRPETAECVDPERLEGTPRLKGAQLLRATLEMVQEPATKTIEGLMPWLGLPRPEMDKLLVGRVFWSEKLQNALITCKLYQNYFEAGR